MATTVILGSGIIGLSTAYYLVQHQPGSSIHLVDSSPELFASASGYAGGFLAKDWFQPVVSALGELSFEEHRKLAGTHGGGEQWGYSKTVTLSYEPGRTGLKISKDWLRDGTSRVGLVESREHGQSGDKIPPWLRRVEGDSVRVVDADGGTAIVDPLRLCQFLLQKCRDAGVQVHHPATALSITRDVQGEFASVRIGYTDSSSETEIPATRLLLSAGAWTPQVFSSLFPSTAIKIPIACLAGHSMVVKTPSGREGEGCHAVYTSLGGVSPEVYSRPNGVIYLTGVNSSTIPLPVLATAAEPMEESLDELRGIAQRIIASDKDDLEVVRTGLCFRPVTDRGTPILARLSDEQLGGVKTRSGQEGGVFVAVGHGPWGISLSLGSGKVMADLMQGREPSADVTCLGL